MVENLVFIDIFNLKKKSLEYRKKVVLWMISVTVCHSSDRLKHCPYVRV